MEKMYETLFLLRNKYKFNGYIHVKVIPGVSEDILSAIGFLADRISVNLELPTAESLKKLAPNKNFQTIMKPMEQITGTIASNRLAIGKDARMERSGINRYLTNNIFNDSKRIETSSKLPSVVTKEKVNRKFAPAGQSTQMIIGATDETDFNLIKTTQYLYQTYDLKRVFYSAYIPLNEDSELPALGTAPPLLREHRLYQADWLLRYYGFQYNELLSEEKPFFNERIDPKCDWALRHLGDFPVEVQTASFDLLLRVPGVGPKSAMRIVNSRRYGRLDFSHLKKMGVVLKRAHYFITCNGKMMYNTPIEEQYITRQLIADSGKENWQVKHQNEDNRQMSLFEDFGVVG